MAVMTGSQGFLVEDFPHQVLQPDYPNMPGIRGEAKGPHKIAGLNWEDGEHHTLDRGRTNEGERTAIASKQI